MSLINQSSTPPQSPPAGTTPKFSVQYCNRGLLLGKPASMDSLSSQSQQHQNNKSPGSSNTYIHVPPHHGGARSPARSPIRSSPSSFSGVGGSRTAIRPLLGFRPDLDRVHQEQLIQYHRAQQLHLFTDASAKVSTFYVSRDAKTGKFSVNDEDLKFRLKALAVASLQYHMKQRQDDEERYSDLRRRAGGGDNESTTGFSSLPPSRAATRAVEQEGVGKPGSLKYTRTLIGDIDIMFYHCMTSDDVASPQEGAAVAFRHTLDQLAKAQLFDIVSEEHKAF